MGQIKDVITREVRYLNTGANLKEAADMMKSFDVGALPVIRDSKVVGLLTDRDIVVRAIADGQNPEKTKVDDAMSKDVTTCYEDDDVGKAAQLMKDKQIRRLVVLNRNEELAGVCSLGDLATTAKAEDVSGDVLKEVSKPSSSK
jgi:predicted transcriptional regulator